VHILRVCSKASVHSVSTHTLYTCDSDGYQKLLNARGILCTGLFEVIVGVLTTYHVVLQMQPHVISFYGVTSRIRFMFLLFPQVFRN